MGIPLLGRSEDSGDIIYWPLNLVHFAFFFAFDCENSADDLICSHDVQKKGLFTERSSETGWVESRTLRSSNATWASSVHSKVSDFFMSRYRGSAFSPSRQMNLLKAARQLVSR